MRKLYFFIIYRTVLVIITVVSLTGCKGKGNLVKNNPAGSTAVINIVTGDNQTGEGGEILVNPVILQVVDLNGEPAKNVKLQFNIIEGSGRIINGISIYTDNNGFAEIQWEICSSYNAVKVSISGDTYQAQPSFIYAEGENPVGMSKTRTINSLEKEGDNLYSMTFYGDYTSILENVNLRYTRHIGAKINSPEKNYFCSIFTIFGNPDGYLFGRSFDNPAGWRCLTLVGRFNPPDGYRSIALSRMRDYGYPLETRFEDLSYTEKLRLMEAAFFVPDGINEHGVVIALANCPPETFYPEQGKKAIYMTYFVREVLDHARNLDEALEIAGNHNIICGHMADVHILIADASGRSAVLEYYDREFRVIPNSQNWQVATNSRVYGRSIPAQKSTCWRFNRIYNALEGAGGNLSRDETVEMLRSVSFPSTQWSAVYDMTEKEAIIAIDADFENLYEFGFDW
ncbi:linear amide C-N hydrolase [candidate division KSB1 bacterium]